MGYGDRMRYLYQIFLEVWFELGLIGPSLLLPILIQSLSNRSVWYAIRDNTSALAVSVLLVFFVLNALTFNDLSRNRMVFVLMGLLVDNAPMIHGHSALNSTDCRSGKDFAKTHKERYET